MCHTLRLCAMSSSSCTLSCRLWCCPVTSSWAALLLFPCTCMFNIIGGIPLSFLNTWPYHLSRLSLRKVVIGSMLASFLMSSLLTWSFLVLPLAHLSILISVVLCIVFLDWPAFRHARIIYHCWFDYGFVDPIFDLDWHLLIPHDSWHFSPFSQCRLHSVLHTSLWASFCHKHTPQILIAYTSTIINTDKRCNVTR